MFAFTAQILRRWSSGLIADHEQSPSSSCCGNPMGKYTTTAMPTMTNRYYKAGTLKSSALEIVMVANDGYLPSMVNFSCRVARCAYARKSDGGQAPNIIEILKSYADLHQPADGEAPLRERLGDNFARGHKQASGGIVPAELFEEFCRLMEIGEPSKVSPKKKPMQKNTLDGYFKRGGEAAAVG